jgi:hypothetical protein
LALPLVLELPPRLDPLELRPLLLELRPLLDRLEPDVLPDPRELEPPELPPLELRLLALGLLDRLPPALREELPLRDCARDELPPLCRPRLLLPEPWVRLL